MMAMLGHNRKMTGAECLADMLKGYGVTHVFMVPAVLRRTFAEMETAHRDQARIHAHGEKSAAYMADGYARASGKPGICMAQVIGALNLAAGLRDAWLAHSPVIAITGGRDAKTKFRKVYQEIDDVPAFEPVTKFNATVDDVARFPDMVRQAFRVATIGHARARCTCSSAATKARSTPRKPRWSRCASRSSRACRRSVPSPTMPACRRRCMLCRQAERPVIVAGGGVRASGAQAPNWSRSRRRCRSRSRPRSTARTRSRATIRCRSAWSAPIRARAPTASSTGRPRLLHRHRDRRHDHAFLGGAADRHAGDPDRHRSGGARPQLSAPGRRPRRRQGDARAHARRTPTATAPASARRGSARCSAICQRLATRKYKPMLNSDAVPIRPERICHELTQHVPDDAIVVVDTGHAGMWMGGMFDLAHAEAELHPQRRPSRLGVPGRARRQVRRAGPAGGHVHRRRRLLVPHRRNRNRGALEDQRGHRRQQQRQRQPVASAASTASMAASRPSRRWSCGPTRKVNFAKIAEDMGAVGIRVEKAGRARAGDRAGAQGRPAGDHRRRHRHRRAGAAGGDVTASCELASELINCGCRSKATPIPTIPIRSRRIGIMRGNLFWLERSSSGLGSSRICRPTFATWIGSTIVEPSAGSCTFSGAASRWCDCPPEYRPRSSIPLRALGANFCALRPNLFRTSAGCRRSTDMQMIDSTHVKAHRFGSGRKRGEKICCGPIARSEQHEDTRTRRC